MRRLLFEHYPCGDLKQHQTYSYIRATGIGAVVMHRHAAYVCLYVCVCVSQVCLAIWCRSYSFRPPEDRLHQMLAAMQPHLSNYMPQDLVSIVHSLVGERLHIIQNCHMLPHQSLCHCYYTSPVEYSAYCAFFAVCAQWNSSMARAPWARRMLGRSLRHACVVACPCSFPEHPSRRPSPLVHACM